MKLIVATVLMSVIYHYGWFGCVVTFGIILASSLSKALEDIDL